MRRASAFFRGHPPWSPGSVPTLGEIAETLRDLGCRDAADINRQVHLIPTGCVPRHSDSERAWRAWLANREREEYEARARSDEAYWKLEGERRTAERAAAEAERRSELRRVRVQLETQKRERRERAIEAERAARVHCDCVHGQHWPQRWTADLAPYGLCETCLGLFEEMPGKWGPVIDPSKQVGWIEDAITTHGRRLRAALGIKPAGDEKAWREWFALKPTALEAPGTTIGTPAIPQHGGKR